MTHETTDSQHPTAPSDTVCSETEFMPILSEQVGMLVHIDEWIKLSPRAQLSRRLLATISEEASDLEDLLDDYDARYNATFAGLLELVSSLSVFALFGYITKNVQVRFAAARGIVDQELDLVFGEETAKTLEFAESNVRRLLDGIHREVLDMAGYAFASEGPGRPITQDGILQKKLPHTVGADDSTNVETWIATEASHYKAILATLRSRSETRKFDDIKEMQEFVREVCDEEQSRFLEAKLQNLQSRYDTFIKNTRLESEDENLARFRQIVGIAHQLVRIMTALSHFYERHETDIREEAAKSKVTSLINKERVLDRLLNYSLYFTHRFMATGEPLADRLLDTYTTIKKVDLGIPDGCFLHARPASLISKIVSHHGTPVTMTLEGESCYAGSTLRVVLLAGSHLEARVVTFEGDRRPISDLRLLFENRLCEDGFGGLPDQLSYLK